jgi:hypothetical protein
VHKIYLKSVFIIFIGSVITLSSVAQIGGSQTYQFLNLTNSARIAGLGGNFLAIKDHDITLTLANPSLISSEMNNNLSLSYVNYFTGPNYGYVMYSHTFKNTGSFVGAFQFINYGKFTAADETGIKTGEFSASEYALNIGWARQLGPLFSIGANGKLIYSSLESYHSFGIAVDVAGTYLSKNKLFTASLIASNIGAQIVPYRPGNREPLPFELQAGVSAKLKHIPVRFSFLYEHIEKWDLSYEDPNDPDNQKDPITGETKSQSGASEFADNFMRHIVIGTEITIAKVFDIRLGYNYGRRQELKIYERTGLSGFSYGFGVRIKMFNFSYTRATYQAGALNPNYITLTANLGGFKKESAVSSQQ